MVSLMALLYYYGKFMTRTVQQKSETHNDPTVRKFAKKLEFQRFKNLRPTKTQWRLKNTKLGLCGSQLTPP